jgi:hypothetical protein
VQFPWRSLDNPHQLEGAFVVAKIVKAMQDAKEGEDDEPLELDSTASIEVGEARGGAVKSGRKQALMS